MTGDMRNFLLLPHGVAALSRPFGWNPPTAPLGRRDLSPSLPPMWGEQVGKEQGRDRKVGPLPSPLPFREVPHQGRGTRESQPVYLQCCPLRTHSGSQIRAGEDEGTTRGPALDGRTRASSHRHTPARAGRYVSVVVQGRSPVWSAHAPQRNNSFPSQGHRGRDLLPVAHHDDRGLGPQDFLLPRPLQPRAH